MTTTTMEHEEAAPAGPDLESPRRRLTSRLFAPTVGLIGYLLLGASHLGVTPGNCTTVASTGLGDGTAGGVWLAWLFDTGALGLGQGSTSLSGAPSGQQVWGPTFYTQVALELPTWVATRVTNGICAVNLTSIAMLAISALAMYALCTYLTGNRFVAWLAGYLYAFSPFVLQKSTGHLAYLNVWAFPLIILFLMRLMADPRRRDAVLCGLVIGSCAWTDPYFIPFSWMLFVTLAIALLVVRRRDEGRAGRLRLLGLTAVIGAVCQLPVILLQFTGTAGSGRPLGSALAEMDTYGARPQDFFAPLWSRFEGVIDPRPYFESSLYLGAVPIVLLIAGVSYWFAMRRQAKEHGSLALVPVFAVVALVLAYFSGPARPHLLGIELPNPVGMAIQVAPQWRVFARLGIVVTALVIVIGAIALVEILRRLRRISPWAPLAVVIPLALLGIVDREPLHFAVRDFDYSYAPPVYEWLASRKDIEVIAEYPMTSPRVDPDSQWATFQVVHEKDMVNLRAFGDYEDHPGMAAVGLGNPQTLPLLRSFGVDVVVVRRAGFDEATLATMPSGLRHINRFEGPVPLALGLGNRFDADVYTIDPSIPLAPAAVVPTDGWFGPEPRGLGTLTWADGPSSTMRVHALSDVTSCRVALTLQQFAVPGRVRIEVDGDEVAEQGVPTEPTSISFAAPCDGEITVESLTAPTAVADAVPGSNDTRSLGVGVLGAQATAAG